jgi:NAD(P)H-dependent FMN reductase
MSGLLIVQHTPTAMLRALGDRVVAGAGDPALADVSVVVRAALEASADDVLAADAIVLGTSANFGYMSGALKHFFDTVFLEVGGALDASGAPTGQAPRKVPYGLWVHGRYDVTGAVRSVQAIVGALSWQQSAPVLEVLGEPGEDALAAAYELGATLAALAGA